MANSLLMQFQADLTGVRIIRPSVMESTALGACLLYTSARNCAKVTCRSTSSARSRFTSGPLRLQHPADNGGTEGGVVHIGVPGDEEKVVKIPAPPGHILPGDGEKQIAVKAHGVPLFFGVVGGRQRERLAPLPHLGTPHQIVQTDVRGLPKDTPEGHE